MENAAFSDAFIVNPSGGLRDRVAASGKSRAGEIYFEKLKAGFA
jgi:hypothetical protein